MDTMLDLRTLAVVLTLISFAISAVMIYVWRSSRIYDGFVWWTAGTVSASVTFIVLALIGTSSPTLSIILSSASGTGSLLMAFLGIRKFFGRQMPYKPALAAWLSSIAFALWFTQINPNATLRITSISLVVAVSDPEQCEGLSKPMLAGALTPVETWKQNLRERDVREYLGEVLYERNQLAFEMSQRERAIKNLSEEIKRAEARPVRWALRRLCWRFVPSLTHAAILLILGAMAWVGLKSK